MITGTKSQSMRLHIEESVILTKMMLLDGDIADIQGFSARAISKKKKNLPTVPVNYRS